MGIPYRRVYRMRPEGEEKWQVVMGLTPLPTMDGLWMWQASSYRSELRVKGQVFVGDEKIVVAGESVRYEFEPLTLANLEDMRDSIHGYDMLRPMFETDEGLQEWYWDEYANGGEEDIPQAEIYRRLQAQVSN